MQLEESLDTGPVYRRMSVDIGDDETADELEARLAVLGAELLVDALGEGLGEPAPQEGEATFAAKLEPDELQLDWSQPAEVLRRVVRAGGAWTAFRGGRLKIHAVELVPAALEPGVLADLVVGTGEGGLALREVQPEGRARQGAAAWANGARLEPGERLGQ